MANGDFDEVAKRIADNLRNRIENPDHRRAFQEDSYDPFGPRSEPAVPRRFELRRNFLVFQGVVMRLRDLGRKTMPGIFFKNGSLPSNPQDPNLQLSNDPISSELRRSWRAHRRQITVTSPDFVDDGSVIEMPLDQSTSVFSNGLARALVSATYSGTTGLIHFTVNSNGKKYRIHRTEQYWYSPVVFGSKLSTPVDDMVYPADYRFGGDLKGGPIIWDFGIHTASSSRTSTAVTKF